MRRVAAVLPCALVLLGSVAHAAVVGASAKGIAAGAGHACVVTSLGGVRCWGANWSGQLGDGTTSDRSTPADVTGLTGGVAAVAAGSNQSCALTTGGGLQCWGGGQPTPADVSGLTSGVAAVALGWAHFCALTTGGGVKCWGGNSYGQLGNGTYAYSSTPVDVSGLTSGVVALVAGYTHTCAVTSAGAMKCWGRNFYGQLGDATTTDRTTPVDVSGLTSGVIGAAAGWDHTCAVMTNGAAKCWGYNGLGQLGDGTTTSRSTPAGVLGLTSGVARMAANRLHTCALTAGGGLKCWGANYDGRLGDGTGEGRTTPVNVLGLTSGVTGVATGESFTCALTAGGGVRCWGDNSYGQVGNGGATSALTPADVMGLKGGVAGVSTGAIHTCALTVGGGVKCWGYNGGGQVGDGSTTSTPTPVDVPGLASGVASVGSAEDHTCAVTAGGGLECWGDGSSGQLGDGTGMSRTTPTAVPSLSSGVAAVEGGYAFTCALKTAGGVKCWGTGGSGQLGDGTGATRLTPTDVAGLTAGVTALAVGYSSACAVTTTGGVKCWGANRFGQLGDGATTDSFTPVDVSGLASGIASVSVGYAHACALTTGGGVKCWGENYSGELGDGTTTHRSTPVDVSGLSSGVAAVAAGDSHTCALTTGGGLKCWGSNMYGRLGDGTTASRTTPVEVSGLSSGVAAVAAGREFTCAVTTAGGLKCWGYNDRGQLGNTRYGSRLAPARALGFGRPDFDGDDRVDVAVFRPSSGTWFSLDSISGNTAYRYQGWGVQAQNDTPVVGDFDGDGIDDPTVFRPASGTWFILKSSTSYSTWSYFGWGSASDVPVPGDYDGDGTADAAVYRPSTGTWYIRPSSGVTQWNLAFGNATDTPVAGDFDGDGKRDPAVYRSSTGTWFWLKSSTNFTGYDYRGWGSHAQADTPAPGDYDGDGKTDPCVFRPATGTWYVLESHAGYSTWTYVGWGSTGDTLVPADYDGDARTDVAIYRASTGTWYIKPSSGASEWSKVFGNSGDVPLVGIR